MKTFIVDDELMARNELKRLLAEEKDFEIVGEAIDGQHALDAIESLNPDVVFLDIHIPKITGIEVAAALAQKAIVPVIVFVTAYDRYAIQAFDVNAVDYILKPYDQERLHRACEKVRKTVSERQDGKGQLDGLLHYLSQQKLRNLIGHRRGSKDRIFINPADVIYFNINLDDVVAFLKDGQELIVSGTLKSLLDQLDPATFQQTHRAYIVNLDYIEKLAPLFGGNFEVILKDPKRTKLPLSRRFAQKFRAMKR
jgi:DNA-binding LytR/AlgR family response regulator